MKNVLTTRWNAFVWCAAVLCQFACCSNGDEELPDNLRQSMREFVQNISAWANGRKSGFVIIPQNGQELLTLDGEANGTPATQYINALDAVGREDLFYGYDNDNEPTPVSEQNYMIGFLDLAR
jgi:cysteinyl-tRNA synthetase